MSLVEESVVGPSVIRAPNGVDFLERREDSSGLAKLRVQRSPETREISYDETTQGGVVSQSVSMNPVSSMQTKSATRASQKISSTPRVVHDLKEEIQTMREMQRQQEEQHDELLGVLSQERAKNDARNAKTLGLLQKKDALIEELTDQYDDALQRVQDLESALEEEKIGRDADEARVSRLSREVDAYKNRIQEIEDTLSRTTKDLEVEKQARAEIEANMEEVAQGMDAAEEIMAEMESRFEKDRKILENRCKVLETFIGEKLGIDAAKHVRHLPSIAMADGRIGEDGMQGFSEDSKLIKANKALEDALIKHAVETKRICVESGDSVHDVAVPSFIHDEEEVEEVNVETLRSELDQLSKAYGLAQQVALHAESELMAALDREADLQEELKKQGMTSMKDDEEERWREDALDKLVDLEDTCHQLESTIASKDEEIRQLQAEARDLLDSKVNVEGLSKKKIDEMNTYFLELHEEVQSLRAMLHASKQKVASSEARIASLQAVQKFSLDLSELQSLSIDQIDPSSEPIEFLVLSLQEAAQMQTELLESLAELSYINEHREEELASIQEDMNRLKRLISVDELDGGSSRIMDAARASQREEMDSLRSQLRKSVAIQHGQCRAYSELAEKSRSKEADLKASLLHAQEIIKEHDDFMVNLETAVAAIKSGLAKIALVEDGENAAHDILSRFSSPQSILELSVVLADKLTDISQSISGDGLSTGPYASKKVKEIEEKYNNILSAYEAAKLEARNATTALEQFKGSLQHHTSQSILQDEISGATSGPLLGNASQFLNFVSKFEEVLDESARQEHKIQELEMKQSQWASSAWSTLVAKKLAREKTQELWLKFKKDIVDLEKSNENYQRDIQNLTEQLDAAQTSLESSMRRHDMMKDRFDAEMERTKEIYQERIENMRNELDIQDQSSANHLKNVVDTVAMEAEDRCALEYQQKIDDMELEISRLRHQCKKVEEEKQMIFKDFERFQEVKNASVELLEQRLNALGLTNHVERKGQVQRKDALSRIEDACNSDAAYAALQQAKFEKLERQKIEEEMNKLIHHQSEKIAPKSRFKNALAEAGARIDSLDKRLECKPSTGSDIERIKAEWHSEARKVEGDIIRLVMDQPYS